MMAIRTLKNTSTVFVRSSSKVRRLTFLAGLSLLLTATPTAQSASGPLKICLLSASAEYDSEKSLSDFQGFLESNYQVVCRRAFGKDKGESLPGLEALTNSDLMIVITRRVQLPPLQLEQIHKFISSGRPIIGLRTASHAFANYPEFDHDILGGGYKGHYTNSQAEVALVAGQARHPVLAGITPFTSRKLYKNPTLADGVTVLLEGSIPGHREPVAWAREHQGRRVFYTSLGTQEDFKEESFRRLLLNAIFWTTRTDEKGTCRAKP
jgi:type 1 glutamine amidotransferase